MSSFIYEAKFWLDELINVARNEFVVAETEMR